ncbi:hypothetical protein [Streptomyces ambofaciens]|uniref:hypothetical protein n=1 Tax=Streptomyces ambofaciens TaxID=1889 RepID=UPI00069E4A0B|nr:hypothetical protein [Streptomyces ambofaciens]
MALPEGAQLVGTSSVRTVSEAVGQAMATQDAVCLFGDPGRGKTAAARMALSGGTPGLEGGKGLVLQRRHVPARARSSIAALFCRAHSHPQSVRKSGWCRHRCAMVVSVSHAPARAGSLPPLAVCPYLTQQYAYRVVECLYSQVRVGVLRAVQQQ